MGLYEIWTIEARSKLEEKSYFYWAMRERWLCDNFYKWHMENLKESKLIVAYGKKSSTLYMTTNSYGSIIVAKSKEDLNIWH